MTVGMMSGAAVMIARLRGVYKEIAISFDEADADEEFDCNVSRADCRVSEAVTLQKRYRREFRANTHLRNGVRCVSELNASTMLRH